MVDFNISIADVNFHINAQCPETAGYCREYITDNSASQYDIIISPEDIKEEYNIYLDGISTDRLSFSPTYFETLALQRKLSKILPERDTIPFHGSAISYKGNGIIFSAPSGTGKSTHSAYWKESFGDDVMYVNDDKPFLRVEDDAAFVCGSPWMGKHHRGNNIIVPLYAICFIERSSTNSVVPVYGAEVFSRLMRQSYFVSDTDCRFKTLNLLKKLTDYAHFYIINCTNDVSAAHVCKNELFI